MNVFVCFFFNKLSDLINIQNCSLVGLSSVIISHKIFSLSHTFIKIHHCIGIEPWRKTAVGSFFLKKNIFKKLDKDYND